MSYPQLLVHRIGIIGSLNKSAKRPKRLSSVLLLTHLITEHELMGMIKALSYFLLLL